MKIVIRIVGQGALNPFDKKQKTENESHDQTTDAMSKVCFIRDSLGNRWNSCKKASIALVDRLTLKISLTSFFFFNL